ncbi:MAG TPA: hypothetical protein VMP11_08015 [Verrucomicrobiae bacterium]|nr:hypothetical protein [Verrucomicrobiae bacterium]
MIVFASSLMLLTALGSSPQEDADLRFWKRIISQCELENGGAFSPTNRALHAEVVDHLKRYPDFLHVLEGSLRFEDRAWVRAYSLSVILQALHERGSRDYVFCLSDPDKNVRGMAQAAIREYKVQEGAQYLAVLLPSKDSNERWAGLKGIEEFQRGDGFPYYAAMLYDPDADVACEAARAFERVDCKDADPVLYRFLCETSPGHAKQIVVKSVIHTLCCLHHEACASSIDDVKLPDAVDYWIRRLNPLKSTNQ